MDTKEEFEPVACNLCRGNSFTQLFTGRDYLFYSPHTFTVAKCNQCGLVSTNPRPRNMGHYYRNYHKATADRDILSWLSPDKAKRIIKLRSKGRVLDVGCGRGKFLLSMKQAGWEVYGNDISSDACTYVRNELGLENVYHGHLLSLDFPKASFDVITLWHVLEHLEKPRETLEYVYSLLKDNGVCVIECPDFSSPQRRIFKDKWYALDVPRHLHHFSPRTIRKMVDAAGFRIYRRDFFIDPRVSFISLKMSMLRLLGKQLPPIEENSSGNSISANPQKAGRIWRISRFVFNWTSVILSEFLNAIYCNDLFRVYCRKVKVDS